MLLGIACTIRFFEGTCVQRAPVPSWATDLLLVSEAGGEGDPAVHGHVDHHGGVGVRVGKDRQHVHGGEVVVGQLAHPHVEEVSDEVRRQRVVGEVPTHVHEAHDGAGVLARDIEGAAPEPGAVEAIREVLRAGFPTGSGICMWQRCER